MNRLRITVLIAALLWGLILPGAAGAQGSGQFAVQGGTLAGGGGAMVSANYVARGTIGQVTGMAESARYAVIGGRWQPAYVYRVYLPLMLRTSE